MRRLLSALALCAGVFVSRTEAQAPPGTIAWTECLGGRVKSWIDAEVVGTDSAEEILTHEAVHRAYSDSVVLATGDCPTLTPAALLNDEIRAYCVSNAIRVRRTSVEEARASTLRRLFIQFKYALPMYTISSSWEKGCPRG